MTDAASRPPACDEPERRQFDFWVGAWEVRQPDGTLVGRNTISPLFDGCALREEWRGESGHRGTSLNAWSPQSGTWHQTWVDSSGLTLLLEGGMRNGSMVMEGDAALPGEDGRVVRHRITWSVVDGDPHSLRQHWEAATDEGTWETLFDGRYSRAG
jgi:hypothetical protein